jgi:hypothetical protein
MSITTDGLLLQSFMKTISFPKDIPKVSSGNNQLLQHP